MKNRRMKTIALLAAGVLLAGSVIKPCSVSATGENAADLDGVYHAALGISTENNKSISRKAYYAKSINRYYKTKRYARLLSSGGQSAGRTVYKGKFTDAVIKGNGRYRVKLTGADFAWETVVSDLHVATDIPDSKKITFSDVSLKINGKAIVTFAKPYMEKEKKYQKGGMDIVLLDKDRQELVRKLSDRNVRKTRRNGYNFLRGAGDDSVVVTFTVDGFNYNKGEAIPTPTPQPTLTPTAVPKEETAAENREQKKSPAETAPDHRIAIAGTIVGAVILCGGVILIVNGRRKRK